jgi:uncharacterized membrane protein
MRSRLGAAAERARQSLLLRPLSFVVVGIVAALALLGFDAVTGPELVPAWLRFDADVARTLFTTMAGAALTIAGITFWVRAAAVQMAASQFTPRVVQGFLHDWFQQSMMGLLLGIFSYLVVVLRAIPADGGDVPHAAVLVGVVLAGGSVLAVLWAIRNGVESMQAGELARRITDRTVDLIRRHHPPRAPRSRPYQVRDVPNTAGHVVRATTSGWVADIDEQAILQALDANAVVRLEVRVGLFVREGRALCTIWSGDGVWLDVTAQVRGAIRLARSRTHRNDIHYGIQQLADVARGSLVHGTSDPGAANEVIVHLEIILRELLQRDLPPVMYIDDEGRQMIRRRDYSIDDYVGVAYDELRLAAVAHPMVATVLLDSLGALVQEVEQSDRPERAAPLRRQGRLVVAACARADLLDEDLAQVRATAARHDLLPRATSH